MDIMTILIDYSHRGTDNVDELWALATQWASFHPQLIYILTLTNCLEDIGTTMVPNLVLKNKNVILFLYEY